VLITKNVFRTLVISSAVLALFAESIDYFFPNLVPAELRNALQEFEPLEDKNGYLQYIELGVALTLTLAWLVSVVGLFSFWSPARALFVASLLVPIVWAGTLGPQVMSGQSEALMLLSLFFAGIITAIMYLQPVSGYFRK